MNLAVGNPELKDETRVLETADVHRREEGAGHFQRPLPRLVRF